MSSQQLSFPDFSAGKWPLLVLLRMSLGGRNHKRPAWGCHGKAQVSKRRQPGRVWGALLGPLGVGWGACLCPGAAAP